MSGQASTMENRVVEKREKQKDLMPRKGGKKEEKWRRRGRNSSASPVDSWAPLQRQWSTLTMSEAACETLLKYLHPPQDREGSQINH